MQNSQPVQGLVPSSSWSWSIMGWCGRNANSAADLCHIFYFYHFLSSFVSSDVDFSPCFLSVSAALHPRCQLELGGAARSSSAFVALFYRTVKPLFWCAELTLCPCVSGFNSSDSFPSQHHQTTVKGKRPKTPRVLPAGLLLCQQSRGIHAGKFLLMGERSWSLREMFGNCFA